MGANAFEYNVKLNLNAETKLAKAQIGELQKELQSISQLKISTAGIDKLTDEIHEASNAALTLQANLQNALNPQTGNLDFTKFISSINKSGNSVEDLAESLLKVGPSGSKAFMSLADSISRAEIPLTRTNKLISGLWDNLKKTAGWQVSSSVIHGIMGQYQQAMGYAQALDKSLTDIRIVTGQSADQMARFAKEANAAAKKLSTTTTDYTNASLIYYQQGLSDAEVKKRSDITIKMANATGTNAAKVSDQLTSIWNNFDNGTKSLEHYADVMTALGAATASSTDEIAKGIQKFAAISDTVGLSYEYAASALATITATTRESADTVGNSLKTLFSRIQGLQLGETLDDGTTLNKYSTALAKVGISIKDSSGALRDMNSILDDMGAKWHTLAEDQQMALAQTVGGVRQYTQIMTLMENWDFFKENLNIANSASGALTMQADIYADSWEAASQRMRASMEGLWDTLIDSESFKSLLNLGSTIVDGITKAIEGLGGTTGIIHTLGGILGNVFNTQISTAISNGIYNIGAIIDPKGTKQRAVAQQQAILQQMSDTIRSSGGYIDADGLEGKTYSEVLRKQARETVDRERHRSMMMEENYDLDAQYEAQLKEIRQNKIDSARRIDQGKKQFEAAIDSLDAFETEAGDDKSLAFVSDGEWKTLQQNYQDAQSKADKKGGKQDRAANVSKAQSALLNAAAIRSGQMLDENEIDFTQEIRTWADRSLSQDADFDSILSQFRMGTAKRTAEDIKRNQQGKDYTKVQLEEDLQKAVSTLLGGDSSSADQGVAKAYDIITKQITSKISSLTKKGLIDPTGKILAGHEEEVISALSGVVESVQGDTYKFNRERIASRVRSKGAKLAIDSAYQGALDEGKGKQEYKQAGEDEQKKEQDRANLESRMTSVLSATTQGVAGLASTTAGIQGFESAFKSDNLFSAMVGVGSGFANLRAGNQSYAQSMRDLGLGRRQDLLQQQKKYQKEIDDYNNAEKIIKNANAELEKTDNQEDRKILEKQIEDAQKYLNKKGRKESKEKAEEYVNDIAGELESYQINMEKLPKPLQKVGAWFDKVGISAEGLSAGLQAAQFAMKATAQINDYFYNENLRNAQKSQTAVNELSNAYQMSQNNYNSLLAGIEDYNTQTTKLADNNLKGAAKQAAIYDQNQSALNLIDKYNITDFTRIGDTIKINEKALEEAQEASIQSASIAKYAMGLAKVDAKEDQNEYLEEQLERDLVFDERGLQVGGVLAAGATGAAVGAAIGSVVPVVGTVIGAIVGTAVGGLAALGADALGENVRDGSFVDDAIKKTRETGSTSWMDDYSGDEFSASELKKLKEQRSEIKNLAASEEAAEQMDITQRESIAKDLVSNNDRTEDFKYADRLVDGLANAAEGWEELGKNYDTLFTTSQQRIDAAQKINSELGLSGPVTWSDDKKNKMMTYTTADGQTGMISYDTLSRMEGTKLGKANADAYVDTMMSIYDNIKADSTETTAAGMLSFLSSGNFDNATIEETKQAQEYMQKILAQTNGAYNYEEIAKALNLDTTNGAQAALQKYALEQGYTKDIKDEYGNVVSQVGDIGAYLNTWQNAINWTSGAETNLNQLDYYTSWKKDKGSDVIDSMTQSTMGTLYNKLTQIQAIGGDVAASNFLDNLTYLLEESGIGEKNYNAAMESLMALDWSSSNIEAQISDIIESFNGELNMSSEELKNFADILSSTSLAIPDFETEINNLSQLFGTVSKLKIGDSVNEDLLTQLESIGVDLSAYAMKQWDGSYKLLEDPETVQEQIHEKLLDTFDQSQAYADIYEKYLGEDSLYKSVGLTSSDFQDITLEDLNNWFGMAKDSRYYSPGSDVYGKVAYLEELGINQQGIEDLYKKQEEAAEIVNKYKVENGQVVGIYDTDTNKDGVIDQNDTASGFKDNAAQIAAQTDYNTASAQYSAAYQAGQAIISSIENHATKDWSDLTKEERQQVASTYNTLDKFEAAKNDGRGIIYDANGNLTEEGQQQLKNLALQYPELTEYVEAYNNALASKNETAIESAETAMKEAIAMQEALAVYTTLTGKKIDLAKLQDTMDKLREDMGEDGVEYSGTEEELADLAAQVLVAADAYGQLSKNSAQWIANLGEDSYKAKEAAQNLGKYLEIVLGLNDLEGITPTDWIEVIETAEEKLKDVGGLSAVIRGDRRAGLEFGELLARRANGGTLEQAIQDQKKANGGTSKLEEAIDTMQSWFVDNGIEGFTDLGGLNEAQQAEFNKQNAEILAESGNDWETYQAAAEAAGYSVSKADFTRSVSTDGGKTVQDYNYKAWYDESGNVQSGWVDSSGNVNTDIAAPDAAANASVDASGQYYRRTGGGGGGGGGPTKVQVKSAQDLMTRYKVIDQKTTINDMQKTAALQAKDLLYGQSKINQLNTINTLLRKQQQLTSDRITEELDYLEKDKKKIEELIERYNKDAKDEDKINLEYDGFGIITNYKQVIGKWAEEVASYYADGELTAEEGKKAEEYQKKIQDFNTVIKDYEDSLNQLMTSIETYENTLYEMFSNQMETLTYKVQYKIELEQDDLSYMDFYASSIKDSYSMMYTYLELIGSKIDEITGQMEIYQGGYEDLINSVENEPLQLWATQGIEGILTADQIETARSYRDSMIDLYQSAVAARKEIEEQVLRVFDEWNDKINKNITGISRFTDMLSQFKDIINIVGKDVLGISDNFMKTFEQKSINQSMDNIAASKSQYENLTKTYGQSQAKLLAAQEKLEAAKASGDEGLIATAEKDVEYWESIADKTQEEMQSAEDTMLTTLNHTLTMISEQFTNAITEAIDNFNESIYQFNGLEGLVSDYELIREQKDLMVEDYEKIYSLSKLNRDIEKSLNNSNILSGKQKLLGLQKEINELTQNNVELSRYDLEYLQAKYELKLAEMELDNAKNSKDTVRLTKDSEGNWSYIYTQNASVVEEAEQKVEDSLFRMQQLSQQYTEEMSSAMMSITQAMRDEMSALNIQDFESPEAFQAEMDRIQEKYSAQIAHREEELNKSIANSSSLYEQDWANYSAITGYKMSADQDWIDSFNETTLGGLLGSSSDISNYSTLIADSTNKMNEALGKAASTYFVNADKALTTYGSSLKTFGSQVSSTTNNIVSQSTKAVKEVSDMGSKLVTEFETITDTVEADLAEWAEEIGNTLTELLDQIIEINERIAESAKKSIPETTDMIGQEEAAELLSKAEFNNSKYSGWEWDGNRAVHNGKDIVEFNGELVKDVNAALQAYANTKVGSPEREAAAEELKKVIEDYWTFKKILERIYDPTNIDIEEIETPDVTEMATGGYTGEWGNEGKYAVLHEKELVLNKDDTANFLDALNISRQLIEMIEMNARASSFGLGEMHAATIQDSIQTLEQQVNITAEFPDATDHNEIKEAFDNLVNTASQYANRYRD